MSTNQTPVVFTGKAGEYFGIWIVNLLLSIVTLGIYSAWAKVRRKKYFYNNMLIDGVGFDYHAKPINILKGRIIAFALFVLYTVLSKFSPIFAGILMIAFFLAIPWIVVRGMTFNARNSSHRGLRFDFDGKYSQAIRIFIGYPFLILITLGLALPFVAQRSHKFVLDHHKFGLSHFQMTALVKDFYMIYLKLLGVILAIGLVISMAVGNLAGGLAHKHASLHQTSYTQATSTLTANGGFIKVANATEINAIDEAASSVDTAPPAKPESPLEKMLGPMTAKLGPVIYVIILGVVLLYAAAIFSVSAYMQSRIHNLIWNNTTLEQVRFFSTQRMRDLIGLYLSNAIALIFTIGLATPWAQIRMARYRAEHLAISGETDWDKFVGEKKEATRAIGEEIADMFDVDISFG